MLPNGFTVLDDSRMIYSMDYFTSHNFLGRPVAGYLAPVCILTHSAKKALIAVQDELDALKQGYRLKIFDTYRPTRAVADFIEWSKDFQDQKMKSEFYPNHLKHELFKLGYLAEKSSHSRGSTVDLTLAVAHANSTPTQFTELEMGTPFDFFDTTAHTAAPNISELAAMNRDFFINLMQKHGFENYPLEWWHFTLKNEPFPDQYFDFPVQEYS